MRIFTCLAMAPALALAASWGAPAQAQETLAGVGAASAAGATLGAAAAGGLSANRATRGARGAQTAPDSDDRQDPPFPSAQQVATPQGSGTNATTVTRSAPPLESGADNGSAILGQLLSAPRRSQPTPPRVRRSPRAQATYSRRVARLSPTARKRLVLNKYKIAPRGWLASYLPADRYKFGKDWNYVSTETDRFYYRPQDMAARRFNANRVIGFRTWQDAMVAGYRPDPRSRPEPGAQIAYLAGLTRAQSLTRYVEYVYAGQVSPASLAVTVNYVRQVNAVINRNPQVRSQRASTVSAILEASLTGDLSLIPTQLSYDASVTSPDATKVSAPDSP